MAFVLDHESDESDQDDPSKSSQSQGRDEGSEDLCSQVYTVFQK